jgi:hypothetical protein
VGLAAPAAVAISERTLDDTWKRIGTLLDQFSAEECNNYIVNAEYAST